MVNEEILENITALLNSYINDQAITQTQCLSEITNLIRKMGTRRCHGCRYLFGISDHTRNHHGFLCIDCRLRGL
jgi:hypothetical protein